MAVETKPCFLDAVNTYTTETKRSADPFAYYENKPKMLSWKH